MMKWAAALGLFGGLILFSDASYEVIGQMTGKIGPFEPAPMGLQAYGWIGFGIGALALIMVVVDEFWEYP